MKTEAKVHVLKCEKFKRRKVPGKAKPPDLDAGRDVIEAAMAGQQPERRHGSALAGDEKHPLAVVLSVCSELAATERRLCDRFKSAQEREAILSELFGRALTGAAAMLRMARQIDAGLYTTMENG